MGSGLESASSDMQRTSVYAEYPIVNYDAERQVIKHVGKVLPDVGGPVLSRALGIEPISLSCQASFDNKRDQISILPPASEET